MHGLGFNRFAARYLAELRDANYTKPKIYFEWHLNMYSYRIYEALGRKPIAVYLFVGSNAASHALDLFGRYKITWTGTVTHTSFGITGDGTTGDGEIPFYWSTELSSQTTYSFGIYCRTNINSDSMVDLGSTGFMYLRTKLAFDGTLQVAIGGTSTINAPVASSLGLSSATRYDAAVANTYKNGTVVNSSSNTYTTSPNVKTHICSYDGVYAPYFSSKNYSFAFFASGIIDHAALYNAVQSLQTFLARAV